MQEIKNILITGYKGFIGSHLAKFLSSKGYCIVGVDRIDGNEVSALTEEDIYGVDCVVHLAAQVNVWNNNYEQIVKDNILSFIHIFDICKKLGKKFIYASSSCSINITSAYGFSKLFNDIYAKDYSIGLRFHNVYGKNSRKDTLLGKCLNNDSVTLYNDGKNYRHFTYIDDVCKCVEKAFKIPNGLYNVVNPEENSTYEFAKEVAKHKTLRIKMQKKKRDLDKERQLIDLSYPNLIESATTIQEGLKKVF